jgi:hypothetical protein
LRLGPAQLGADLLAQQVDGDQLAFHVEVPELPAVAGRRALDVSGAEPTRQRRVNQRRKIA